MTPAVSVRGLIKVFRLGQEKVRALDGIDLDVMPGEILCIVGPSGSGKSTLLNQLAGLEKPSKGTVTICGQLLSSMGEEELALFRQKHLGFIFQSYNLLPAFTALENVELPLVFRGIPPVQRKRQAAEQLRRMGLGDRAGHKPSEMSGGQQQRVGIARAFVGSPEVIFADEPTGNLDTKTTDLVMNTMFEYARERKITLIMVTHNNELALRADRVVTIRDGKVVQDMQNANPTVLGPAQTPISPVEEKQQPPAAVSETIAKIIADAAAGAAPSLAEGTAQPAIETFKMQASASQNQKTEGQRL